MKKAARITKIIIGFIIISILILCCSSFEWISLTWVRSLLENTSHFLMDSPDAVFNVLLILCLLYIVFDLFNLCCKKVANISSLERLETVQSDFTKEVSTKFSAIDMSLANAQTLSKDNTYQINMGIYKYDNRVKQAFSNMKTKYEKNLTLYHHHTKHLYNIFLNTNLGSKISQQIKEYTEQQ